MKMEEENRDSDCHMLDEDHDEMLDKIEPIKCEKLVVCNGKHTVDVNDDEEETDELNRELNKLNKMIIDDNNNNTPELSIKRKQIKTEKTMQLKQLQIDLKNEEANLILLKRLYYSQRITSQPPTTQQTQQQHLKLQQQALAKSQQLKSNANQLTVANQSINPNQRSIINKKVN